MITLSYGNGRTVRVPKGLSVLEASLRNNVPHASVCGGRARCSTCRIRIIGDCSASAGAVAARGFCAQPRRSRRDPSIRLACQLRPETDLSFFQLFLPQRCPPTATDSNPSRIGQERYLVSMFVDMRGSTKLAEKRLPFDTVFIVNRFLGAVSQAVIECGGQPNQFVGDGMLALFGLATSRQAACRQALKAAAMIAANVDELNQFLEHDLREPIRFGIGIQWRRSDRRRHRLSRPHGVHRARRRRQCRRTAAGHDQEPRMRGRRLGRSSHHRGPCRRALPQQEVAIRGRNEPMIVRTVDDARMLSALVNDVQSAAA